MEKQLSDMSVVELKAMVYDQLAQSEQCQKNMQVLNAEIAKKSQPEKAKEPQEVVVEEVKTIPNE